MSRPVIGVTCALSSERCSTLSPVYPFYHVYAWYCEAIWRAGGRPLMIPPLVGGETDSEALDLAGSLDGIFFSGGGISTDPVAEENPRMMSTQPIRSAAECALVRAGRELRLPMIGSCRGHQIICEGLGGALSEATVSGHGQKFSYYYPSHPVDIVRGSKLAALAGEETWMVNSMHRQYIETCPDGFVPNAFGPEKTIEGMESVDPDWFCVTFQYHPEVMIFDERALRVMSGFVDAARAYAEKKKNSL